ncbi:MAG TPA: ATP-binding protein [Candidatus Saccharimonadales bacterium]
MLNVAFLIYIRTLKLQGDEATWLTFCIGAVSVFGFAETMQRLSLTIDGAMFWATMGGVATEVIPVATFLFALAYTRPTSWYSSKVAYILLATMLMIFYQASSTDLIFFTDPGHVMQYSWGFNNEIGDAYIAQAIWQLVFFGAAFWLLLHLYRTTTNTVIKKQSMLFLVAIGVPVIGGMITDLVLPALYITTLPPLATFFSVVTAAGLVYGIARYRVLRVSPSLLAHNILSAMHEAVIATNDQSEIEYMNAEAEKIFGRQTTRPIIFRLFDQFDNDGFDANIIKLQQGETYTLDNLTVTDQESKKVYMQAQVSKLHSDSLIEGYLFVLSDVTELKQSYKALEAADTKLIHEKQNVERKVHERTQELTEQRARLEASINSLNAGYLMTDRTNNILIMNGAAQHMLFGRTDAATKYTLEDIAKIFGTDFQFVRSVEACLENDRPIVTDAVLQNGKMLKVFLAPISDTTVETDQKLGVVVLIEDITEAKVLERSREEFFSIASHELRTPLTAIRGNASMIKQFYAAQLQDTELHQMVDDIEISSVRLIEIVNDFLDASRLEQGKIQFHSEAFRIEEILENVVYEMSALASQKHTHIQIDKTLHATSLVYADKNRVKQVIYNLVGNAMKFTDKGAITITVEPAAASLKVKITDTGPGISKENQNLLFRKFQQAGNSLLTRETSRGTGLGLYISKLLIDGMGGKMALERSEVGRGSTFSFTVPLATQAQIDAPLATKQL